MKWAVSYISLRCCLLLSLLLFAATFLRADGGDVLDRKIRIKENKGTRYQLLKQVSEQSGYLFIYDSGLINNDETIRIRRGEFTVRNAIYVITGNTRLKITATGNYILLSLPTGNALPANLPEKKKEAYFIIEGVLYDRISREVIPSASVMARNASIGTITNQNGEFKLVLPDSLRHSSIRFSHVGYENKEFEASASAGKHTGFLLEPKVVPLQEIVVRVVNPVLALQRMIEERKHNYSSTPVYLTTFYREGIAYKNKNVDLTEAVLKVYKTGYQDADNLDQVKLIKMRHILNKEKNDTIFTKFKSGINSCLILDMIKHLPDFLTLDLSETPFIYMHTDISFIDDRLVNVISFEQKQREKAPLYKGQLFIDAENHALVEAHFEINPRYAEQATNLFVEKKSRNYKFTLRRAAYVVSYKPVTGGVYYLNQVRGDLEFKVRKKKWQPNSAPLDVWFEMVNCDVDTQNVKSFSRSERLSITTIFSETKYSYDADFWKGFNVIVPEERLKELIRSSIGQTE
ncbi:hypothetical protein EZS27_010778 [termite gut metagenome]|uniref:TonB-dependent receptor SusC n=1 Tax=termite gut metagenome TaxID=433724 RepID=A0A5J4S7U2_9ZZZZ